MTVANCNMATDFDIESVISAGDTFCAPPTISYTAPVEEVSAFVTRHTDSGVPCVITGFPHDEGDTQSPFTHSTGWLESFSGPEGEQCSFYTHFLWDSCSVHRNDSSVSP